MCTCSTAKIFLNNKTLSKRRFDFLTPKKLSQKTTARHSQAEIEKLVNVVRTLGKCSQDNGLV